MSAGRRATAAQADAEVAAAEKFIADLIARGEVADGGRQNDAVDDEDKTPLPSGVTHEIAHRDGDPRPVVKRRRYSAF